jgi:hypothetical protein
VCSDESGFALPILVSFGRELPPAEPMLNVTQPDKPGWSYGRRIRKNCGFPNTIGHERQASSLTKSITLNTIFRLRIFRSGCNGLASFEGNLCEVCLPPKGERLPKQIPGMARRDRKAEHRLGVLRPAAIHRADRVIGVPIRKYLLAINSIG